MVTDIALSQYTFATAALPNVFVLLTISSSTNRQYDLSFGTKVGRVGEAYHYYIFIFLPSIVLKF